MKRTFMAQYAYVNLKCIETSNSKKRTVKIAKQVHRAQHICDETQYSLPRFKIFI